MPDATFSESWYRVANQRICLRPGVRARRQNFRGERWIVLENPFSNQFFRLRPAAFEFIARLRPDRTVQEVWQECIERFPDDAPGQETAIQLLSQLYFANLLQYDHAADSAQLFERYKKRRQREIGGQLMNIMFMKFPLFDPDRFLVRTLPLVGRFISPLGALLWLVVVGYGLKIAADNFGAITDQAQSVLSPANLPLLYLGLIFIKTIHEFGHAWFCRKFGGEVHTMGVMLMIFTPLPYVDATSAWGFRERWKRVLVGAAGMIAELFVAALAAVVWAGTGEGAVHSVAYNMMFVASVSTLLFNLNPLLRFDGYYILSDLLDIPNLHQRATQQLRHLFEHYLYGVKKSESPARSRREAWWLGTFGLAAGVYRVIVFAGILLMVADQFLIIGLVMAAFCLVTWLVVPLVKFVKYLAASPRLDRVRPRAIAATAALLGGLLLVLEAIPLPSHFRAPGVVRATERSELTSETAGIVDAILAKPGSRVTAGQPLLRLRNREIELELAHARARAAEMETRLAIARERGGADEKPVLQALAAVRERIGKLEADLGRLTVRARHAGIWVAPGIHDYLGRWLSRGSNLGLLVNPDSFQFVATVLQEDADAIFARHRSTAQVRLIGQVAERMHVGDWQVIPGEQRTLPSPALGWRGGGDVPVSADDRDGNKAAEPYFKVIADLPGDRAALFDGASGRIRFDLQPEPLLSRWARRLWQLLQKRYQL